MDVLKNHMETIVEKSLEKILGKYENICKCEKCILDIKAMALNKLPPRYGVTDKGNVYARLYAMDRQLRIDVTRQVIKAIERVSKNPHHGGE